jgi:hypothetical protein
MIAIPITAEAYGAIKASLSELNNQAAAPGPDGLIRVWLDGTMVDRLRRLTVPGETYSDVILRLAKGDGGEEWPPWAPRRTGRDA